VSRRAAGRGPWSPRGPFDIGGLVSGQTPTSRSFVRALVAGALLGAVVAGLGRVRAPATRRGAGRTREGTHSHSPR